MNAPANVLAFYAEAHWGSRWGVVDQFHKTEHKGLDVALFHGIVDVPALHGGTVVSVGSSSLVGHYVTVQRADGLFDTYCHIVPGVSVGQKVSQGARLGRQAVTQAEGGLQWQGQHTHLCKSRTRGGWGTWPTLDPTPDVIAVLTGTAGGGSTPIDNLERLATVTALVMTKPGANVLAVFDEFHWQEISYGAGVDPFLQTVADGLQSTLPAAPYTETGWNDRSNKLPGIKLPLYTIDVAKKTITPILPGSIAGSDAAVLAAIAALDTQADNYQAQLEAILAKGLTISGTAVPKA